ncbi:MAG TPA: hypothetical protein VGO67_03850 [Verrucomicrobiae bacterium]|jgi:hypothetical protein
MKSAKKRASLKSGGGVVKNQTQKPASTQEKYRRLVILRVLNSNRTQFSIVIRTIKVYLEPFAIKPNDREIEAALSHLTGEGLAEKSILKGEIPTWKITPKGCQFLDKLETDLRGTTIATESKEPSAFHAFQAKSLSVVQRIEWAKHLAKSKKQRAFLASLEMDVADLVLKAMKATETPTWRVNPYDLHPSSMDKFLFDGIAGNGEGECETLLEICERWEWELRSEPPVKDGIFAVLVLPFLGELSDQEKDALGAIYGRWTDLLRDERRRRLNRQKTA